MPQYQLTLSVKGTTRYVWILSLITDTQLLNWHFYVEMKLQGLKNMYKEYVQRIWRNIVYKKWSVHLCYAQRHCLCEGIYWWPAYVFFAHNSVFG